MSDKRYRPGEVRAVEVRILPNRGDVDVADLVVTGAEYRVLRFKKNGDLEELYTWVAGSYDSDRGVIMGTWNGALEKIAEPGHYAVELRAIVDTELPRHLVTVDVEF